MKQTDLQWSSTCRERGAVQLQMHMSSSSVWFPALITEVLMWDFFKSISALQPSLDYKDQVSSFLLYLSAKTKYGHVNDPPPPPPK